MFSVLPKKLAAAMALLFTSELRPWHLDLLCLIGLVCLNPMVYGLRLPVGLPPDAIGYLSFAEVTIRKGLLYLPGWGHADNAVILPPLFPLLIAALNALRPNGIGNGVAISYASALLVTPLVYFYVRRFAPVLVAAAAVLLVQFSFDYMLYAGAVLTESLFVLMLVLTFFLAMELTSQVAPKIWQGFVLGLLSALVYLTRQVGLVVGAFFILWFLFHGMRTESSWRRRLRLPTFFLGGWLLLVLPYVSLLYFQTGEVGLNQSFRAHTYLVTSSDTSVLGEIQWLERSDGVNYQTLYVNRRKLRELLPSGTEMLAYVVPVRGDEAQAQSALSDRAARFVVRFVHNVHDNIGHFVGQFGKLVSLLSLCAFFTPLFLRPRSSHPTWPRLILPAFLLTYVLALSVLTGVVARYITILFPLVAMQIAVELGALYSWWRERKVYPWLANLAVALLLAPLLLSAVRTVLGLPRTVAARLSEPVIAQQVVTPREPMFALLPGSSYLVGGIFRVLPNDTFERAIHYGRLTGVRWLLVPRHPESNPEVPLYTNAGWLHTPQVLAKRTDLVRYCCTVNVGDEHLLFEIVPTDRGKH